MWHSDRMEEALTEASETSETERKRSQQLKTKLVSRNQRFRAGCSCINLPITRPYNYLHAWPLGKADRPGALCVKDLQNLHEYMDLRCVRAGG